MHGRWGAESRAIFNQIKKFAAGMITQMIALPVVTIVMLERVDLLVAAVIFLHF